MSLFDTVYFRTTTTAWVALHIPGVGKVDHHFDVLPELHQALLDYVTAQAALRVAEIQANMTAKGFNEANATKGTAPKEGI